MHAKKSQIETKEEVTLKGVSK